MIDLTPEQLEMISQILTEFVADCEIRVFGSRIKGTAKPWSDLDLAVVGHDKLPSDILYNLKEAFEESDLSIRVDVLDWNVISPEFQRVINADFRVLDF